MKLPPTVCKWHRHVNTLRTPIGPAVLVPAQREFALRLQYAFARVVVREGGLWPGDPEFGRRVGARLAKGGLSHAAVADWRKGTIPDVLTVRAIAEECDVDPGWLAFGYWSNAGHPPGWNRGQERNPKKDRTRHVKL